MIRVCPVCKKRFKSNHHQAIYCSRECCRKHFIMERRSRKIEKQDPNWKDFWILYNSICEEVGEHYSYGRFVYLYETSLPVAFKKWMIRNESNILEVANYLNINVKELRDAVSAGTSKNIKIIRKISAYTGISCDKLMKG